MDVTMPADLECQVEKELAAGHYRDTSELVERAVRQFFDEQRRGSKRLAALRRVGAAVDQAGFYDRVARSHWS